MTAFVCEVYVLSSLSKKFKTREGAFRIEGLTLLRIRIKHVCVYGFCIEYTVLYIFAHVLGKSPGDNYNVSMTEA